MKVGTTIVFDKRFSIAYIGHETVGVVVGNTLKMRPDHDDHIVELIYHDDDGNARVERMKINIQNILWGRGTGRGTVIDPHD